MEPSIVRVRRRTLQSVIRGAVTRGAWRGSCAALPCCLRLPSPPCPTQATPQATSDSNLHALQRFCLRSGSLTPGGPSLTAAGSHKMLYGGILNFSFLRERYVHRGLLVRRNHRDPGGSPGGTVRGSGPGFSSSTRESLTSTRLQVPEGHASTPFFPVSGSFPGGFSAAKCKTQVTIGPCGNGCREPCAPKVGRKQAGSASLRGTLSSTGGKRSRTRNSLKRLF